MKVARLFRSIAPLALTLFMYLDMPGNVYGKELSTTTAGWENVKLKCTGGFLNTLQCTLSGETTFHLVDSQDHPYTDVDVVAWFPQEVNDSDHPNTERHIVKIEDYQLVPVKLSPDEHGDVSVHFDSHFFPNDDWDNNWVVLKMKVVKRIPNSLVGGNNTGFLKTYHKQGPTAVSMSGTKTLDNLVNADQSIEARMELSKKSFNVVVAGGQFPADSRSNTQTLSFINADKYIAQLQAKADQLKAEKVAKDIEDAKPIPIIPGTQVKDRVKNKLYRFLNATEEDVANAFMSQPQVADHDYDDVKLDNYDRVLIYGAVSPIYVSDFIYTKESLHFYFKHGKCKQVIQVFAGNSANREAYPQWALVLPKSLEKMAIVDHKLSQGSNMVLHCNFPSDEWTIRAYAKPAYNQRSGQYDGFADAHIFEVMLKSLK